MNESSSLSLSGQDVPSQLAYRMKSIFHYSPSQLLSCPPSFINPMEQIGEEKEEESGKIFPVPVPSVDDDKGEMMKMENDVCYSHYTGGTVTVLCLRFTVTLSN